MKRLIFLFGLVMMFAVARPQCFEPRYLYADDSCKVILPDYRDSIAAWDNCCLELYTQTPYPGEVLAVDEKIDVTLLAKDCSGNEATIMFSVFVVDTIPPVFICEEPQPPPVSLNKRLIVLTDPNIDPNKETDDQMSLVRLMLYANEFDIEGLIATCSHNLYDRFTEPIENTIQAYELCLPNLRSHDDNYPDADQLLSVTALGPASYGTQYALNEQMSEGGWLIVNAIKKNDPRPIWITIWGDGAVIAQALNYIRQNEGEEAAQAAASKLRILDNAGQDDSGAYLKAQQNFPDMFYIRWVRGGMAMDSISDTPSPGLVWFPFCGECAAGDVSYTSDYWVEQNIQPIGPLGALYPDRRYLKEGDTPTLLYLLSSPDPEDPTQLSWGGKFKEGQNVRSIRHPLGRDDEFTETEFDPYTMWELDEVTWDGKTNIWAGIYQHWPEFQEDFKKRINWTITP